MALSKSFAALAALVYLFTVLEQSAADSWGLIEKTEFYSATSEYVLQIWPHPDFGSTPGHCRATLYRIEGGRRASVWSRDLINNHAPVSVFVADSGKYVVTMDEWHFVGTLPVVVYGPRGELIRVHSTDSLGLRGDVLKIASSVSSYWWNADALSFFGPDDEHFFIRLHWGKVLMLDLRSGDLMDQQWYKLHKGWFIKSDQWKALQRFARSEIRRRALSGLRSSDPRERSKSATLCGQLRLTAAIPRLERLLDDPAYTERFCLLPPLWQRSYYVRHAAQEALKQLDQAADAPRRQ